MPLCESNGLIACLTWLAITLPFKMIWLFLYIYIYNITPMPFISSSECNFSHSKAGLNFPNMIHLSFFSYFQPVPLPWFSFHQKKREEEEAEIKLKHDLGQIISDHGRPLLSQQPHPWLAWSHSNSSQIFFQPMEYKHGAEFKPSSRQHSTRYNRSSWIRETFTLHMGLGDYLATFLTFPNTISLSFVRTGRAGEAWDWKQTRKISGYGPRLEIGRLWLPSPIL